MSALPIRRLHALGEDDVAGLADVLVDCVSGGASVSFVAPLGVEEARAFWRGVAKRVAAGDVALLVAEDGEGIVGTVQLVVGQPPNQPHRADLAKMLVHRRGRRRGLGAALLRAAEDLARDCGRTLLVLDTNTGSDAERLYAAAGWVHVGSIPDYSIQADGSLGATTYFYKRIPPEPPGPTT